MRVKFITCRRIMPPTRTARTRTGDGHLQPNMYFGAAIFRLTTAQLQELCRSNGLSALGRRKTLENRLKTAGIAPATTPNDQPVNRQLPSTGLPVQQRANPNAEEQITEIKRLVQDSVAAAARDIAREAARAATGVLQSQAPSSSQVTPSAQAVSQDTPGVASCHFRPTGTATALTNFTESTTKRWVVHINAMPSWSTFSGDSGELC